MEVFCCDYRFKSLTIGLFEVVVQRNVPGRHEVLHYFGYVFSSQTISTQDALAECVCPKHFLLRNIRARVKNKQ